MDPGAVQSGRIVPLPPDAAEQNEVDMEDHEILRRLIRLLSKSEEDELFAQGTLESTVLSEINVSKSLIPTDARRQPSSSAVHTLHRSKSEGDATSVQHSRSRSVLKLADTAPLRVTRPPKPELQESFKGFERSSKKLRARLARVQSVLRPVDREKFLTKAASKMSIHLENVTNYMKQQIDILAQADSGPPNEVHARNLTSALLGLAGSSRTLARGFDQLQTDTLLTAVESYEAFESLAQLAESEARSLKDSKADESLKRMSGIHFRQHSVELNEQFASLCEEVTLCLSEVMKSGVHSFRQRKEKYVQRHILRTGISVLFAVITAMMFSVSVDRDSSTLGLAASGVWLISLASGIAAGITGMVGLFFSEESSSRSQRQLSEKVSNWLAKGNEMLFLLAATLFSIGLCIFAFSSVQAIAARVIVIVFTSLHFIGLFAILFWFFRSYRNEQINTDDRRTPHRVWPSIRELAHLSIRSSAARPGSGGFRVSGMRDVEAGGHSRIASYRRSAPPIIRITDTDQEQALSTASSLRQVRTVDNYPPIDGNRPSTLNPGPTSAPNAEDQDSEGDSESTHGSELTSLSFTQAHANLTVPPAQRVSSDSSRSLPALPPDVQIVRCMAYSPNGMFLCIGNASPQERCTIFSTDSPAITLGELKLTDIALQIEWSSDGENILLRLSHMIYVWNALPSAGTRRPAIIIYQDSDNLKWLVNGDSFLSSKKDILTSFHIDGTPTGVFQIPTATIQDFVVTHDGLRIICLVSNFASARSGKTGAGSQKLIVYNLEHKAVEQIAPVGRDAQSILRSMVSSDLVLVNFTGTTPPQIWRYRQNTDSSDRRTSATFLSFKRAMSFKAPSGRFAGHGIFGSTDDKLVLSLGEDGDMFIFTSDTGQPLRHVITNTSQSSRKSLNANADGRDSDMGLQRGRPLAQCVAWDPDILTFTACMGYSDGSIWQWKVPFNAIGQENRDSEFAVVALRDDEAMLIRPPDVEKPVVHAVETTAEETKGDT